MNMTGFTFKGKHSGRDMRVFVRTVSRPITPPVRTIAEETIPGIDGSIDFSEQTGRLRYDDKILELEIKAAEKDNLSLHRRISHLSAWLSGGYGELIFDDMPYIIWTAKPVDIKGLCPEIFGRTGKTTIQFRCKPFNTLTFGSTGVLLGDENITLGTDMPLDYGKNSTQNNIEKGWNDIEIVYIGTAPVAPIVRVVCSKKAKAGGLLSEYSQSSGTFGKIEYSAGEDEGNFFDEIEFDCEKLTCKVKIDGETKDVTENILFENLPELIPGKNEWEVLLAGDNEITGIVTFEYNPKYLYGEVGFDDTCL